jgi:hypothetical protein
MALDIEYHEDRLKELTLHVAARCQRHRHFGVTKLNKILFFADFIAYKRRGVPITGAKYMRGQFGPVPAEGVHVRQALVAEGRAAMQRHPVTPGEPVMEKRLLALVPANLSIFEPEHIAIVEEVIEAFRQSSGRAVSDLSHALPGWKLALDGEEIPYFTALLPKEPQPLGPRDAEWARGVEKRYLASRSQP